MKDICSIKTTIVEGTNYHLYENIMDEDNIYLSLTNVEFNADKNSISVKIPIEIWAIIRRYAEPDLQYAGWTDTDIVDFATKEVNERINNYNISVKEEGEALASLKFLYGSVVYGMVTDPKEEQINATIEYIKTSRDLQDKIQNAIANAKD